MDKLDELRNSLADLTNKRTMLQTKLSMKKEEALKLKERLKELGYDSVDAASQDLQKMSAKVEEDTKKVNALLKEISDNSDIISSI